MHCSDLVGVCMCVCVSSWHMWVGWADVGLQLWVAVCFLAKISLHRRTCKTTFARLTQSQAISQSFRAFISFRSRRDTTFFHFSKLFLYKITVSFTMVIKRSPGGQACRWRAINFEIHLWSSGKNADCIFGDRSASSMSKWRPAWTLTPEMIHFRTKSVTLSMLIDLLIIGASLKRAPQLRVDLAFCHDIYRYRRTDRCLWPGARRQGWMLRAKSSRRNFVCERSSVCLLVVQMHTFLHIRLRIRHWSNLSEFSFCVRLSALNHSAKK